MATDHKAMAMDWVDEHSKRAQVHATLYVGDQIARVADALERQGKGASQEGIRQEDPLSGIAEGLRVAFRAMTR